MSITAALTGLALASLAAVLLVGVVLGPMYVVLATARGDATFLPTDGVGLLLVVAPLALVTVPFLVAKRPALGAVRPRVRRRLVLPAAVGAALLVTGLSAAAPAVDRGVVASVADGDTLTLLDGRRVRLVQIDAPELGSGECYSRAARTELLRLAPVGSRVVLEADARLDDVDRYGRVLRYVWRNGVDVNLALVRRGAAAPYFYDGDRGRFSAALMTAAKQARAARRGLWKACPSTRLDPYGPVQTGQSGPRAAGSADGTCDPNYAGGCVPPYPPDLDCADIRALGIAPVQVVGADRHRLDGDHDGLGCE
jgi:endonuclease YncB( thermonuclease family)